MTPPVRGDHRRHRSRVEHRRHRRADSPGVLEAEGDQRRRRIRPRLAPSRLRVVVHGEDKRERQSAEQCPELVQGLMHAGTRPPWRHGKALPPRGGLRMPLPILLAMINAAAHCQLPPSVSSGTTDICRLYPPIAIGQ